MRPIKLQQKNYKQSGTEYQLVLPLDYEVIIPEDDSVRLLSQIVERMDLTELYKAYSEQGRKPATSPKQMFKVIAYSYMDGEYSTRKIEKACNRDINYMWLLQGEGRPDHSTVSRFRKDRLRKVMEGLFYQLVRQLCELGEVSYENVFQDGTKLEANANRYTFVWKKALEKHETKMHERVVYVAEEINKLYFSDFSATAETMDADIYLMIAFLEKKMTALGIAPLSGSGKRKSNEQKLLEALRQYRERQLNYDESKEILDGRNSYSKTDKDATFMRMKDDHMKNGQLKPAYNIQLAVESEYVIGADVFSDCNDLGTMKPLLETMYAHNPAMEIQSLTADSGFESEENYLYLEGKGITFYIKPQNYEQQKKRSYKKDISKRENMAYDPETDEYTCANDKRLKPIGISKRKTKNGFESELTIYGCEDCTGCPLKEKCTKAKGNRQIRVSKTFIAKRAQSYENITSEKGIILRMNRSIQSEGAFGIIKQDRQFTRFLMRGKANIKTETLLLCFGFNVNKLHAKIQAERFGKGLHLPQPKTG